MRIVAWNCCGKTAINFAHLLDTGFDVAAVAECGPFDRGIEQERTLTHVMHQPYPDTPKHLAVFAQAPFSVEPHPFVTDLPWALVTRVTGPVDFTLLVVWPIQVSGWGSYTAQFGRVISEVLPNLDGPVVLAGDLNAPVAQSRSQHLANVTELNQHNLVSAFLHTRDLSAAQAHNADLTTSPALAEPTYFHHRSRAQAQHIDHVFVPTNWVSGLKLTIGDFETWVGTGRSDHVPLVVDVASPANALPY